jgi:hypothetical protein
MYFMVADNGAREVAYNATGRSRSQVGAMRSNSATGHVYFPRTSAFLRRAWLLAHRSEFSLQPDAARAELVITKRAEWKTSAN